FSWKEYVRDHDRRLHVADHLSMLDKVQAIYVYTDKAAVTEGTYTTERGALYNYVAGKMLKNILWAARNSGVKKGDLTIRFSQRLCRLSKASAALCAAEHPGEC
ncbi:hypothetical protein CJ199_13460, partial [Brevibacterium paucivorans]